MFTYPIFYCSVCCEQLLKNNFSVLLYGCNAIVFKLPIFYIVGYPWRMDDNYNCKLFVPKWCGYKDLPNGVPRYLTTNFYIWTFSKTEPPAQCYFGTFHGVPIIFLNSYSLWTKYRGFRWFWTLLSNSVRLLGLYISLSRTSGLPIPVLRRNYYLLCFKIQISSKLRHLLLCPFEHTI